MTPFLVALLAPASASDPILTQLTEETKVLRERNEQLHADVNDIKTRPGAIEGLARSELGLIKPGETFYQIVTE